MYSIIRIPDALRVEYGEGSASGADIRFTVGNTVKVYCRASGCSVKAVRLRWNEKTEEPCRILSDDWERLYGNAEWRGIVPERIMPWYMLIAAGNRVQGIGVKVRPSAICSWQLDRSGITLMLDLRCGSDGVELDGRELMLAEIVSGEYENISPWNAAKAFCGVMSDGAVFPKEPVYGSNNWYYAYGKSSHEEILRDSGFVSSLCTGNNNRPHMVIDDGWEPHSVCGPWDRGNGRFPDMRRLAREMKDIGVSPGIWIRPLFDDSDFSAGKHCLEGAPHTLDVSDPAVLDYVKETVERIRYWGYTLIKHDFSSYDISGTFAAGRGMTYCGEGRHFANRSRTTAELAKDLYRTIYESAGAGEVTILGCNCINHLCVGYVHLNRSGDDTSGINWERTRRMGINALAFRLCQNEEFFRVDADCVGLTAQVPWEKNRQWLDLLSRSGTPLFVSAEISNVSGEMKTALREAFARASVQKTGCEAVDWMENTCPAVWKFGDKVKTYNWDLPFGVECDA